MATPIVRGGVAGRQKDEPQLLVGTDRRPRVWRAARVLLTRARLCVDLRIAHVEGPDEGSGDRVKTADDAGRLAGLLAVADPAPDHHLAAHDLRRGTDVIIARTDLAETCLEIKDTACGEILAKPARAGIEDDEASIDSRPVDTLGACAGSIGDLVIGDAAAGGRAGDPNEVGMRVVDPALLAGLGVERDDLVAPRAEVKRVADLQRRDLKPSIGPFGRRVVAGAIGPCHLKSRDVVRRELRER
ncbi:hypothetical protein D9M73_126080 [compost metagenome]